MQSVRIGPFLGHRVRFGADLRCRDADCGTLWMRVDGRERSGIAFDNMMTRTTEGPVSGDRGWTRRSVVLDVAEEAASVHYGFFLKGYGRVWARNVQLDIVESDVPVTGRAHPRLHHDASRLAEAPSNLDFREA